MPQNGPERRKSLSFVRNLYTSPFLVSIGRIRASSRMRKMQEEVDSIIGKRNTIFDAGIEYGRAFATSESRHPEICVEVFGHRPQRQMA